MAEFLTTTGTAFYLENIIKKAKQRIYIISPYLEISNNYMQRLIDADKEGKEITIIYKDDKLKELERKKLHKLKRLNLYNCPNLHAKCYANEEMVIVTSMNMIEASEKKNREMGVVLRQQEDEGLFSETLVEIQSIINSSEVISLSSTQKVESVIIAEEKLSKDEKYIKNSFSFGFRLPVDSFLISTPFKEIGLIQGLNAKYYWDSEDQWEVGESIQTFFDDLIFQFHVSIEEEEIKYFNNLSELSTFIQSKVKEVINSIKPNKIGYCIREGIMIPYNLKMPMCDQAYKVWSSYNNPKYPESFCHRTGKVTNGKNCFERPVLFWND